MFATRVLLDNERGDKKFQEPYEIELKVVLQTTQTRNNNSVKLKHKELLFALEIDPFYNHSCDRQMKQKSNLHRVQP